MGDPTTPVGRYVTDLSWQVKAACADLDPRDFDQPTGTSALTCPDCPVRFECWAAGMHPQQQIPGPHRAVRVGAA